jgi:uncharacterized membrane-anchored protein
MTTTKAALLSKVPAITFSFWLIKIAATTLGETGGDTVTMTMDLGYLVGAAIFFVGLIVLVGLQIKAQQFRPFLYWATIIASTTCGTALADFADRSLGMGYVGGSLLLATCLAASLAAWYTSEGSVSLNDIATPRAEILYWVTVTFSQTLGTALGDWIADTSGLGYAGGALVFLAALSIVVALYYGTELSRVGLFWLAFILTRPLGATVGDFFDKPATAGGLDISRPLLSLGFLVFIVICISVFPQRPATNASGRPRTAEVFR